MIESTDEFHLCASGRLQAKECCLERGVHLRVLNPRIMAGPARRKSNQQAAEKHKLAGAKFRRSGQDRSFRTSGDPRRVPRAFRAGLPRSGIFGSGLPFIAADRFFRPRARIRDDIAYALGTDQVRRERLDPGTSIGRILCRDWPFGRRSAGCREGRSSDGGIACRDAGDRTDRRD